MKRMIVVAREDLEPQELENALKALGCVVETVDRPGILYFDAFAADLRCNIAWLGTRAVNLTQTQMRLLCYLAGRAGEVVSRRELQREVFGCHDTAETRTVDTHMAALRKKIEGDPARPVHLITVRGQGYQYLS